MKTFYAKTMADALRQIKAELGEDALLLSTKEIPSRSGVGGAASGFEVVAASDDGPASEILPAGCSRTTPAQHDHPCWFTDKSADELRYRGQPSDTYTPSTLLASGRRPGKKHGPKPKPGTKRASSRESGANVLTSTAPFKGVLCQNLYLELIESGVEEWLASRLVREAEELVIPKHRRSKTALIQSVSDVAQKMITAPPSHGIPARRVVAFMGPTGVGKTTSVAKLAARLALQDKKKVVLMTLDGFRIGAIEQLKTYAGIMGIPFRYVSQVSDLPKAIQEHSQRDYILIDTTGRSPNDLGSLQELAEFLRSSSDVETHLVLSATTKSSDLRAIVDRFAICSPDHLIFTKLDETSTLGPIFNELVRSHKSMSYYSDGQKVPQDFHAVSRDQIINFVLNHN